MRAFRGHDAGDAGSAEHVALFGLAAFDQNQCFRPHRDEALGDGAARRDRLSDTSTMRACPCRRCARACSCRSHRSRATPWSPRSTSACRIRLSPTRIGVNAGLREPRKIGGREDAAFADDDPVRRNLRRQLLRRLEVHFKRLEVAIVDADEAAVELRARDPARPHRALRRWHPCPSPSPPQRGRGPCASSTCGKDDQDAVGAPGARFGDLIGVEHEVLAQHRAARRLRAQRSGIRARPETTAVSVSTERHAAPPAS